MEDDPSRTVNKLLLARVFPNPYTGIDPLEELKSIRERYNEPIGFTGSQVQTPQGTGVTTKTTKVMENQRLMGNIEKIQSLDEQIARIEQIRRNWVDPDGNSYWDFFSGLKPELQFEVTHYKTGKKMPVNLVHCNPRFTDPTDIRSLQYLLPKRIIKEIVMERSFSAAERGGMSFAQAGKLAMERMDSYRPPEDFIKYGWVKGPGIYIVGHGHVAFSFYGEVNGEPVIIASPGSTSEEESKRYGAQPSALVISEKVENIRKMVSPIPIKRLESSK
jgi:hypothetical protein